MKDTIKAFWGGALQGGIWAIIQAPLLFMPTIKLGFPIWAQFLIAAVILFVRIPILSLAFQGLWIWGLIRCITTRPQTWFEIVYYIVFLFEAYVSLYNAYKHRNDK